MVGELTGQKFGMQVLADGGNAVDAIVAAALVATVAAPASAGGPREFLEFSPVSNWLWISSARGVSQNWFSRQSHWPKMESRGQRVSPIR